MPGRTRWNGETDWANVPTPGRAREVSRQQVRAFSHDSQHGGFVAELVAYVLGSEIPASSSARFDCFGNVLTSVLPLPVGLDNQVSA